MFVSKIVQKLPAQFHAAAWWSDGTRAVKELAKYKMCALLSLKRASADLDYINFFLIEFAKC